MEIRLWALALGYGPRPALARPGQKSDQVRSPKPKAKAYKYLSIPLNAS